jgi:Ca-activated chloride channel family protein
MDQQRHGQDEAVTRQAVLAVALTHHLVSKYTSLVAVDKEPIRPTNKDLLAQAVATNLPEGQQYQAIFGLPKTATNGRFQILFGLALLIVAALAWNTRRLPA